ncbi:MAG: phosphoserine phosphatase SerB [Actinomycetota bacterium]|nr:phosphoserine phosphatase SerB [Actinomycetota bacterium]
MAPACTLLLTLSGADRPGVTSALFAALAPCDVEVLDVEQVVIRGRLTLGVLVTASRRLEPAIRDAAEAAGSALGLAVDVSDGGDEEPRRRGRTLVTVLGSPLRPADLAGIAGRVADTGANIDRIVRIAAYPVTAIELEVSGADPDRLRPLLAQDAARLGVDVAVERGGLHRRAKRLICMDVDSTLVQGEVIEMLAAHAGCEAEVTRVTEAAMRGELDFAASLRERVALLAGLDAGALDAVRRSVQLAPGARTLVRTLKRLDYRFAVVSGGFSQIVDPLAADLGIDYAAANTLEIADGKLTGRLVGPVVDRAGKAEALERFAADAGVPLSQTVAIGDGANDLDMLGRAGLGIAFNAKPVVRRAADAAVTVPYLDAVLYMLGISRGDIEAADAAEGVATAAPPLSR